LLQLAKLNFPTGIVHDSVAADLHGFMLERLRHLREQSSGRTRSNPWWGKARGASTWSSAARGRAGLSQAAGSRVAGAANKRIRNILKKAEVAQREPDPALLKEPAEKSLYAATTRLLPAVHSLVENEDYTEALRVLAGVRAEVDTFFDQVMVMTDEPVLRNNRLALLAQLERLLNQVADISRLAQ
jgi:glycyl-tRNA synthetase beta chain